MENLKPSNKYQVSIRFFMDDAFMDAVPAHRLYINDLIIKSVIDYYAVSMESMRSWIIINANDKETVSNILEGSPLHKYWEIEIDELFIYDGPTYHLPALQLN